MKNSITHRLAVAIVFMTLAASTFSTTYTFTGSGNWSIEENWDVNGVPPSDLSSGNAISINGSGSCNMDVSLTLENGATLTIQAGKVLVLQAGIQILNSGTWNIFGQQQGISGLSNIAGGTLSLKNGGKLVLNQNMNAAQLPSNFNWESGGTLTVAENYSLTLNNSFTITTGGILEIEANASLVNESTLTNNGSINNSGIISNTYTGTIDNNGTLNNQTNSYFNEAGTFDNTGGTHNLNGTLNIENSVASLFGGTFNWNLGGKVSISGNAQSTTLTNNLTVPSGGTLEIQPGGTLTNDATLTNQGTLTIGPIANFTNNTSRTVNNLGTLTILGGMTNNGTLNNAGGTFNQNGSYIGTGNFSGSVFTNPVDKTLAPGSSPGCLTFSDGFINNGNLQIELGNGAACTGYDKITVTGDATINGTIIISFPNGVPTSSTFTILTATGSLTGAPSFTWPTGYTGGFTINSSATPKEFQVHFSVLPVELTSFTARVENGGVRLDWHTASETDNSGFEVQRAAGNGSRGNVDWQILGFLAGHGTTNEVGRYAFVDEAPLRGINYYRLRQIDFDGGFEYSKIVSIDRGLGGFRIYPNPTYGIIQLIEPDDKREQIQVFDVTGRAVFEKILDSQSSIDLSSLPKGVYFIVLRNRNYEKILLQ
jgi:hypothetical protein